MANTFLYPQKQLQQIYRRSRQSLFVSACGFERSGFDFHGIPRLRRISRTSPCLSWSDPHRRQEVAAFREKRLPHLLLARQIFKMFGLRGTTLMHIHEPAHYLPSGATFVNLRDTLPVPLSSSGTINLLALQIQFIMSSVAIG